MGEGLPDSDISVSMLRDSESDVSLPLRGLLGVQVAYVIRRAV